MFVLDWDRLFPPQLPPSLWSSLNPHSDSRLPAAQATAHSSSSSPLPEMRKGSATFSTSSSIDTTSSSSSSLQDSSGCAVVSFQDERQMREHAFSLTQRGDIQEREEEDETDTDSHTLESQHEKTFSKQSEETKERGTDKKEDDEPWKGRATGLTDETGRKGKKKKKGKGAQHALSVRKKKGKTSRLVEKKKASSPDTKAAQEFSQISTHPAVLAILGTPDNRGVREVS